MDTSPNPFDQFDPNPFDQFDPGGRKESSAQVKKKFEAGTATRSQLAEAYKRENPDWNKTAWEKYRPDYAAGGWVTDKLAKYEAMRPYAAAAGGLTNAFVNAIPIGLSGNLKPETAVRPEVQRLLDQGVVPTVGQAANPNTALGGMTRKAEDALMSVRGVGDVVAGSRTRALEEFNRAALTQAMPSGKVSQVGNAGIEEVRDALSSAYDKLYAGKNVSFPVPGKPEIPSTGGSISLADFKKGFELGGTSRVTGVPKEVTGLWTELNTAKTSGVLPLNAEGEKTFEAVLRKSLFQRIPEGGQIPADVVKSEIIGDIGKAARQLQIKGSAYDKATGDALFAAKNIVQDWLNNATGAKTVAGIDAAYKARIMLGKAAERAAAQGGVFTPYQLLKASKEGTSLKQLAMDAQAVMGNSLPNSGTIDRGVMAYFLRNPTKALASIAGMVPTGAVYSRPVQNALIQGIPGNVSTLGPGVGELSGILHRPVQDSMVPLSDLPTGNR